MREHVEERQENQFTGIPIRRILARVVLWTLVLATVYLVLSRSVLVQAQANSTATPTANPTIVVLEKRVETLITQVANIEKRADVEKQDLEIQIQKSLIPVYIWSAILSALGVTSAVGIWLWIKNWIEKTRKSVEEETRKKLDQAFYNADPLYYPIYIPINDFDTETTRLRKLGFKDLRPYGGLRDSILNGIIVFRVPGKSFQIEEDRLQAEAALGALEEFIVETHANERKVAFVLYITGGTLGKASQITASFDNVVIANMPVTIAEHVYALVRGLTALELKKEDK